MLTADEFRTPFREDYAAALGRVVYIFACDEWLLISTGQKLRPGFVAEARAPEVTFKKLAKLFEVCVADAPGIDHATKAALRRCAGRFRQSALLRNTLIHAHPATDSDGSQRLHYWNPSTSVEWPDKEVENAARKFDDAVTELNGLYSRLY